MNDRPESNAAADTGNHPEKLSSPEPARPPEPAGRAAAGGILSLWFGLSRDVSRSAYAATGFGLMLFKYLVEASVIYYYSERFFLPTDFLNPLLSIRQQYLAPPAPDWLAWALFVWSLPFVWIAVSMSVRRAVNAGLTAWAGLFVLMPVLNFALMLLLAAKPSRGDYSFAIPKPAPQLDRRIHSALAGVAASVLICLIMLGISVYGFEDYGAALFLGTPILMGAVSAFLYNRPSPRGLGGSILVAEISVAVAGMVLLLFAFEGIICLAMLFPIGAAMGAFGALIGYTVAAVTPGKRSSLVVPVLVLPIFAGIDSVSPDLPLYEVATSVEIDAPPQQVWPHVIGFSELPPPANWYFQLGVAYPMRATIQGSGVGAVRHCEFSTGPFVEPITVWEEPRRLGFDVVAQPPPMHELSPYRHVHPPHLDGYLRCKRGEFRLIELPGGRTRLEGSTWYEYDIYPQQYWILWSDLLIHRIHTRVLNHIKHLSESNAS